MQLKELLTGIECEVICGSVDKEITSLIFDSRKAQDGAVFVCISGAKRDAHEFIPDVVSKGVQTVVVEKEVNAPDGVTVVRVKDTKYALALLSANYFRHPARSLKTIGITGTKGKTTTTYMVKQILEDSGIKTGLIGTIEIVIGEKHIVANNTTPAAYDVQKYFREMVDAGLEAVVMEVSSQGLMLHRVAGFTFDYGVFTNLEPDHIGENEHKDFADYLHCKSLLFRQCRYGIFNKDSEHFEEIQKGHTCEVETFGFAQDADLRACDMQLYSEGGVLGVGYRAEGLVNMDVKVDVPGRFSVYNSLTAIAICRHFGVSNEVIAKALLTVTVKGRIELVPVSNKFTVMIDYAHNAMALESLLITLKEYNPGRLVCMFGCGGDRSHDRRFEMGEISSKLADLTVVTSDNPRTEDPMAIIQDILTGVRRQSGEYVEIPDRREAIAYCLANAKEGDVIVLAGKGHEDYQEINGKKYPMDERVIISEILESHPEYRQ